MARPPRVSKVQHEQLKARVAKLARAMFMSENQKTLQLNFNVTEGCILASIVHQIEQGHILSVNQATFVNNLYKRFRRAGGIVLSPKPKRAAIKLKAE